MIGARPSPYIAYTAGTVYAGQQWRVDLRLAAAPNCQGDANNDNTADFADITAVLASFGCGL